MFVRRVRGSSMSPALKAGDIVIGWHEPLRIGKVVVARKGSREVIKRVEKIDGGRVYLVGDNRTDSTDSRHYGFLNKSDILGTVMIVLPKSVKPPKLVKPYGVWFGRGLALLLAFMAVVHLFRIDTFLPILDDFLPGGSTAAAFFGVGIILSEIFAIPFALRMKLSPLAHLLSGALLVLAPLWWLLIGVWTLGLVETTGQLGNFVEVPATIWVLALNALWVGVSYYTLYIMGYNNLRVRDLLKK